MAKQQIDILTARAWLSGSNELLDQVKAAKTERLSLSHMNMAVLGLLC